VTDADLVLGYLNPDFFLGGAMRLDVDAARRGIEDVVGAPLGYAALDAAWAVHEVVNENMAAAMRMYATEKAGDLDKVTLVAFGGAGPVHADGFARKLGVRKLPVPRGAGVFSAFGFLVAPVAYEVSRTRIAPLAALDSSELEAFYGDLEVEAAAVVNQAVDGVPVTFHRAAEIRYLGQGATVRVAVDGEPTPEAIMARFLDQYRERYGEAYEDQDIQLATLRVTALAERAAPELTRPFDSGAGDLTAASKGERAAYEPRAGGYVPHAVYAMDRLPAGARIEGPAIIEEESSTLVMGVGTVAEVDGRGWLAVDLEGGKA
jgi:N-methylhydantoinase A